MNSSAEDLKDYLDGISSLALTFKTNLFVARMPDTPDQCVVLYDSGGFAPYSNDYQRPTVQIRTRGAQGGYQTAGGGQDDEMQPSMLAPQQETQEVGEQYAGEYPSYQQQQDYYGQGGQQYQPYQEALSSDVITEIAEQVVSEKLSFLGDKLEKAIDFKTTAETKISNLGERLVRIEQILDKLQIALLHRVGEYVQDVADMKKEIVETQKSFKAISQGHHSSHSSGQQTHPAHHSGSHSAGKHRP